MAKRGENIYKRKDGRWEARYVRARDEGGKAVYGYCYGRTYREAKEKLCLRRAAPAAKPPAPRPRFSALCGDWLALRKSEVKLSTYVKYEQILREHILPAFGDSLPETVTGPAVERFRVTLLEEKKLSSGTVKIVLVVLRAVAAYGAAIDPENARPVEVRCPKAPGPAPRVLNREEQDRLVLFLRSDPDPCKLGILLALLTGIRLGELCALRWEKVSLKQRVIRIDASLQRLRAPDAEGVQKTVLRTDTPKSETSLREIPLSEEAAALCARMQPADERLYLLTGTETPMEPRTLQYRLKKYARACGLEGVHFHTLRHTFATRCVEAGFEIKSLSEVLGHSSTKITLDRYVHSSMDMKRGNMNKLTMLAP